MRVGDFLFNLLGDFFYFLNILLELISAHEFMTIENDFDEDKFDPFDFSHFL